MTMKRWQVKDTNVSVSRQDFAPFLNKFGITQEKIEKITGAQGCGCNERKKWFNKIFSYNKEDINE